MKAIMLSLFLVGCDLRFNAGECVSLSDDYGKFLIERNGELYSIQFDRNEGWYGDSVIGQLYGKPQEFSGGFHYSKINCPQLKVSHENYLRYKRIGVDTQLNGVRVIE